MCMYVSVSWKKIFILRTLMSALMSMLSVQITLWMFFVPWVSYHCRQQCNLMFNCRDLCYCYRACVFVNSCWRTKCRRARKGRRSWMPNWSNWEKPRTFQVCLVWLCVPTKFLIQRWETYLHIADFKNVWKIVCSIWVMTDSFLFVTHSIYELFFWELYSSFRADSNICTKGFKQNCYSELWTIWSSFRQ